MSEKFLGDELGLLDLLTIMNSIPLWNSLIRQGKNEEANKKLNYQLGKVIETQEKANKLLERLIYLLEQNNAISER